MPPATLNHTVFIFSSPKLLIHIPEGVPFDIGRHLSPRLTAVGRPTLYALRWILNGSTSARLPGLWQAIRALLLGDVRQVQIPGREVRPGNLRGLKRGGDWDQIGCARPGLRGGMSRIEPGVTIIGPAMIGPSCHICEGCHNR